MLNSGADIKEDARVTLYKGQDFIAEVDVDSYGQLEFALDRQGDYDIKY